MKLNDKTTHMKRLISITLLVLLTMTTATAQTYYTRFCPDKKLVKEARKWMKSGEWRNGFTAAKPHKSVNAVDFYEQYQKNPEQWKALFRWLSETDVLAIPKGKHPIPGTQLVASVEDSENGPLEKRNSESHFHHIDFQWTVKGTEGFGPTSSIIIMMWRRPVSMTAILKSSSSSSHLTGISPK